MRTMTLVIGVALVSIGGAEASPMGLLSFVLGAVLLSLYTETQ
jgi:succinate-acetate transporter protein